MLSADELERSQLYREAHTTALAIAPNVSGSIERYQTVEELSTQWRPT